MMEKRLLARTSILLGFIVVWVFSASSTVFGKDDVERFYRGKNVEFVIGNKPGGGYNAYARLVAKHMADHIPGGPNLIPKNMTGAGGAAALFYLANVAPKDGSAIGNAQPGTIMEPLLRLKNKNLGFDPLKFNYLGNANTETSLCILRREASVKTFQDALKKEAALGGSGSSTIQFTLVHNGILGTKFKLVRGYGGTGEISLAVQRGEVDGLCGQFWSSLQLQHPEWVTSGAFNIIVQEATTGHPILNRMGVPLVYDFAKTKQEKQALDLFFLPLRFGRPFVAPPGVPAERLAALRKAFSEAVADPKLLAEAKKMRLPIDDPISGEEVQKLVSRLYETPPSIVERVRKAVMRDQ